MPRANRSFLRTRPALLVICPHREEAVLYQLLDNEELEYHKELFKEQYDGWTQYEGSIKGRTFTCKTCGGDDCPVLIMRRNNIRSETKIQQRKLSRENERDT